MPKDECDPEDPMEFVGVTLPGDTRDAMAECFVEEYIFQGFTDDQILRLFQHPFYAGTHAVYQSKGEAYVRELTARIRGRWGHPRFRTAIPKQTPKEVNRA